MKTNIEGEANRASFVVFKFLWFLGNIKAKQRKAAAITPDVVKLILAHNKMEPLSWYKYVMKPLNPHPAAAQARIEKLTFTIL
jgi:hypothetical protein